MDQSSGMAKTSPGEFIRQVRQETSKVTWPTRKELGVSVIMVFIMVFIASIFFLVVDQIWASVVRLVLGLGG
jgi:preprotein translocase subunit SecE